MKLCKPTLLLFSILWLVLLSAAPQVSYADFTIAVIGDVQNHQSSLNTLTTWIVNNKVSSNIAFVAQMGDVSNNCTTGEYNITDPAFDLLVSSSVKVPYGVVPGNHDSCGTYDTYYGAFRYTEANYPSGYYQGSLDARNHYFFFSADGMDFIIFFLQYSPGTTQTTWVNNLLAANRNRRGIVVSHNIISYNDAYVNQATYTSLSANPNLFLMLCGHMHTGSDGEGYKQETRSGMNPVHIIMTDYQDFPTNVLRTLTFDPENEVIIVSHGQGTGSTLNLTYDMPQPLDGDFAPKDCDVDGTDLYKLLSGAASLDLNVFAQNFGKNACP